MAGTYTAKDDEVIATLSMRVKQTCLDFAQRTLDLSNQNIAEHVGGEGIALGSGADEQDLIASGYIATADKNGYEEAKTAAAFGRDAKRGLWADPVEVPKVQDGFVVYASYAMGRAHMMHEGYTDPRKNVGEMQGFDYLGRTENALKGAFFKAIGEDVKSLESIAVPTVAENQRDLEVAFYQEMHAAESRDVAANERDLRDQFLAQYGKDVMQRERNTLEIKGYRPERSVNPGLGRTDAGRLRYQNTGRMIPVYRRETASERDQRVEDLYAEWKLTRVAASREGGF